VLITTLVTLQSVLLVASQVPVLMLKPMQQNRGVSQSHKPESIGHSDILLQSQHWKADRRERERKGGGRGRGREGEGRKEGERGKNGETLQNKYFTRIKSVS
jgi:hypothetical protein